MHTRIEVQDGKKQNKDPPFVLLPVYKLKRWPEALPHTSEMLTSILFQMTVFSCWRIDVREELVHLGLFRLRAHRAMWSETKTTSCSVGCWSWWGVGLKFQGLGPGLQSHLSRSC